MIKKTIIFFILFGVGVVIFLGKDGVSFSNSDEENIREMFNASKDEKALSDFLDRKFDPPYESYELSLYYANKCQETYLTPYQVELLRHPLTEEAVALAAPNAMGEIERGGFLSVDILNSNIFHLTASVRNILRPTADGELSANKLSGLLFGNDKSNSKSKKIEEEFKTGEHFRNLFAYCYTLDFMVGILGAPNSITKNVFDEVSNEISLGEREIRNERINNLVN